MSEIVDFENCVQQFQLALNRLNGHSQGTLPEVKALMGGMMPLKDAPSREVATELMLRKISSDIEELGKTYNQIMTSIDMPEKKF